MHVLAPRAVFEMMVTRKLLHPDVFRYLTERSYKVWMQIGNGQLKRSISKGDTAFRFFEVLGSNRQ